MIKNRNKFIVFEGVAGSGKSTIIRAIRDRVKRRGQNIFDLNDWFSIHAKPPTFSQVEHADVLFTFEPTKAWIGSAIRDEMSHANTYSGLDFAHAFSLDRLVQYRRLIIPALQNGKTVIQDRSVGTSIAYQPAMKNGPSLEKLLELPGNALALKHPPTDLILTNIEPEQLQKRFQNREDGSKGVFENIELLKRFHKRYHSDWFRSMFEQRGTRLHRIDTEISLEQTLTQAINLIKTILNT